MKKCSLFTIVLFFFPVIYSQSPFLGKLGVNLGYVDYVDWVKATNRVNYIGGQVQLADSSLDENLWPRCDFNVIWDHRPAKEWEQSANPIDDPEQYRIDYSGVFYGSFNGLAELADGEPHGTWTIQNQVYDTLTNTTTFEIHMSPPGPHHGLIFLEFRHTRRTPASDTNTGITNFKLIRPGYDTSSTQIFTDVIYDALDRVSFSTIRAMGLTGTTSLPIVYPDTLGWNSRKKLSDPWWGGSIGKRVGGAPWEAFIDLCNAAGMDMWVNIPFAATDDYMVQLAKLIQSRLKPFLHVYVEIDNEVWGFPNQKAYNEAEAKAKGITAVQNYAVHAYRAAKAFESVFGTAALNDKVRILLQWWSLSPADLDRMCDYLTKTYGPVNQYIYGIGVAHYFSNDYMSGHKAASVEDIVISAYQSADDDTALFKQIATIAAKYNLTAKGNVSYEGGAAMCDPLSPNQITARNDILAYRDSCMAAAVRKLYLNCNKYGAVLSNYFTLANPFNRDGCWGLTDDPAKPERTSLTKAMQELLGDVQSPVPPADLFALKQPGNCVKLSWKDQSTDEGGFIIERKDTNDKYILVKQVPAGTTVYIDTVTYYQPKYYRVKAFNSNGTSTYANLAMVIDSSVPPAPKNVVVFDVSKSSLRIRWNKAEWDEIKEYRIYKNGVVAAVTQDTSYTMLGLKCGDVYHLYVVTVSKSNIYSLPSDTVTVTMCQALDLPAESLSVMPNPTADKVKIIAGEPVLRVMVLNTGGILYKDMQPLSAETEIDLSDCAEGVYLIKVFTGSEIKTVKIIKQK